MIQEVLDLAPGTVDAIAEEAGVSRATIYAWATGRRNPTPENLHNLAVAVRRRGEALTKIADKLEAIAGES